MEDDALDVRAQTDVIEDSFGSAMASKEEIVGSLRMVREHVGQICELSSEEKKIVAAFSQAMIKLMRPLVKTIPVDPSVLPMELGDVERANVLPNGKLIILQKDGQMDSIDLNDDANRDILVEVITDVVPKFTELVKKRRAKIERRMGFLASVTREIQNIAEAFSSAIR